MTPLFKKLNFKNHKKLFLINSPYSFNQEIDEMSKIVEISKTVGKFDSIDFILCFVLKQSEVDDFINLNHDKLEGDVIIWYCYPKMSSKRYKCEFNRDTGWNELGKHGYEPVRAVALDEDWSALRFRKVSYIKTISRDANHALTQEAKSRTTGKNSK